MPPTKKNRIAGINTPRGMGQAMSDVRRGKKRQSDVRVWTSRIHYAEREQQAMLQEYDDNEKLYIGISMPNALSMEENSVLEHLEAYSRGVYVNRALSSIAGLNASIMWKRPWHYLRARRAGGADADLARLTTEGALNFVLGNRRNNWLLKARLMCISTEMHMGVLKAVYAPHEGEEPEEEEQLGVIEVETMNQPRPDGGTSRDEVIAFVGGPPKLDEEGRPIIRGRKHYVVETRSVADYYKTEFVYLPHMRFDPEGGNDLHDGDWATQRMCWKVNDFLSNPLFNGAHGDIMEFARFTDIGDLSRNTKNRFKKGPKVTANAEWEPTGSDREVMRLWGWQCWDKKERRVTYLVDGYERAAAVTEYPRYIDTFPYSVSKFHERPGDILPVSELGQARPLIRALSEMSSMHLSHTRRFSRWYIAKKGMFDVKGKDIAKDGDDGRIAEFQRGYSINDFKPVEDAPLSPDVYRLRVQFIEDLGELLGRGAESRAVAQSDTATQAAIIQGSTTSRDNDRRGIVAEALEHHAQLVLRMMQTTLDRSLSFQMQGPQGQLIGGIGTRARIQGDYDVTIDLQDLEPHDSAAEKRDLNEIVQILGPMAFASRTFAKRFWAARRIHDPQLVEELVAIGSMMLEQAQQGGQKSQGSQQGGPSPTRQGPEEGRGEQGRSAGRQLRVVAGAGERGPSRGKVK